MPAAQIQSGRYADSRRFLSRGGRLRPRIHLRGLLRPSLPWVKVTTVIIMIIVVTAISRMTISISNRHSRTSHTVGAAISAHVGSQPCDTRPVAITPIQGSRLLLHMRAVFTASILVSGMTRDYRHHRQKSPRPLFPSPSTESTPLHPHPPTSPIPPPPASHPRSSPPPAYRPPRPPPAQSLQASPTKHSKGSEPLRELEGSLDLDPRVGRLSVSGPQDLTSSSGWREPCPAAVPDRGSTSPGGIEWSRRRAIEAQLQ